MSQDNHCSLFHLPFWWEGPGVKELLVLSCVHVPRMQRERAEMEQNFAREIGNLVQRLSAEKDQLEAELKLKMDQEVMAVRWVEL